MTDIECGTGDWMQTYTGRKFYPLAPRMEDMDILDIARSLSNQCRYNGHCHRFYSVAEHSVLVSHLVPPEHAKWGLMHDAPETWLFDMIRPIKRTRMAQEFRQIERRIMSLVCAKFGLPATEPEAVKDIDNRICLTEGLQLMPNQPEPWGIPGPPIDVKLECWSPDDAMAAFLNRYNQLFGRIVTAPSFLEG